MSLPKGVFLLPTKIFDWLLNVDSCLPADGNLKITLEFYYCFNAYINLTIRRIVLFFSRLFFIIRICMEFERIVYKALIVQDHNAQSTQKSFVVE